ncbi:hypothetical protein [Vibrio sp. Hal054]|uniref:hypothetical protein n=1 Tax=Vibrio sp. Hal054 TaxID=3035158 RepID=UPI00301B819B
MDIDVWANDDGQLTATQATVPASHVHDDQAPYGFTKHVWRVDAVNGRAAMKLYREQMKQPKGNKRV